MKKTFAVLAAGALLLPSLALADTRLARPERPVVTVIRPDRPERDVRPARDERPARPERPAR